MVTRCHMAAAGRRCRFGDTLVEVALCVAIVGLAMAALMGFMGAGTDADRTTTELSIGVQAARAAWEDTRMLSFAVVQSWVGHPPAAVDLPGHFQRVVQVQNVDVNNVTNTNPAVPTPGVVRVVVQILKNNALVYTQSWILSS